MNQGREEAVPLTQQLEKVNKVSTNKRFISSSHKRIKYKGTHCSIISPATVAKQRFPIVLTVDLIIIIASDL